MHLSAWKTASQSATSVLRSARTPPSCARASAPARAACPPKPSTKTCPISALPSLIPDHAARFSSALPTITRAGNASPLCLAVARATTTTLRPWRNARTSVSSQVRHIVYCVYYLRYLYGLDIICITHRADVALPAAVPWPTSVPKQSDMRQRHLQPSLWLSRGQAAGPGRQQLVCAHYTKYHGHHHDKHDVVISSHTTPSHKNFVPGNMAPVATTSLLCPTPRPAATSVARPTSATCGHTAPTQPAVAAGACVRAAPAKLTSR